MKLSKNQCEFILNSQFCIIATSDKENLPRACVVMPEMAFDDKVILADCQMGKTRENILANNKVFVSFYDDKLDWCLKCDGIAEYIDSTEKSGGGSLTALEINWSQKACRLPELSSSLSHQPTSIKNILNNLAAIQKNKGFDVQGLIMVSVKSVNKCQ